MENFTDILDEYGVSYITEGNSHCRDGWVQFDCPFCGRDSAKFHMGFSVDFHYTNCWQCGKHSVVSVLIEVTDLTAKKIVAILRDLPRSQTIKEKVTGTLQLPDGVAPLKYAHKRYLESRGYVWKSIQNMWRIQGIGLSATHPWRIFIPVYFKNEMVSWTTRSISPTNKQRYLNASVKQESMDRTSLLYGEDYCRHAIVICEGALDAWRIGAGATALLGLNVSAKQIERILKYPMRIVCFDNQNEAQRRAKKLTDVLSLYDGETYNVQLDSKDAGCATKKEIRQIRKLLS